MRATVLLTALIVLGAMTGLAIAQGDPPQPGEDGVVVNVVFSCEERVHAGNRTTLLLEGNITYVNPYQRTVDIHLIVNAGSWNASIAPTTIQRSDAEGEVPFEVNVTIPEDGRNVEVVRVTGTWETPDDGGEVVPDKVETYVVPPVGEHDSTPNDLAVMAVVATAATASILMVGYAVYSAFKKYPIIVPFYTRLNRKEIMAHRARHDILETVESDPGVSLRELVDQVEESRSSVMYHLRVLEKEGLITSYRKGRNRCYTMKEGGVFHTELDDAILEAITTRPGIDVSEISRLTKTSKQVASYHVSKLDESDQIWVEKDGRSKRCYPRDN